MVNVLMEARTRVEHELVDLKTKIDKLNKFMESDKFNVMNKTEQLLLHSQYNAMLVYANCLTLRLDIWRNEIWPTVS